MRQIISKPRPIWGVARRYAQPVLDRARSLPRWGWLLGMLFAGAAVTSWSDGGQPAAEGRGKTLPLIRVESCTIKSLQEVVLAFDRPGVLGKVMIQEGDTVTAGQFLASLKDDVARAALAVAQLQADSEVEILYAELAAEVAKTEYDQMTEANRRKTGTIPELEVRRARLNHDKNLAEWEKAKQNRVVFQAKRDEAAAQLDTYRLDAPFDGFVTRLHLVTGASVKQGDSVIELVNTRKVRVEGHISVKDAALVQSGCAVEVQLDKPNEVGEAAAARKFPGRIVFVDAAKVTALGSKVRMWAEVENPDRLLRAGLTATMTIQPVKHSD